MNINFSSNALNMLNPNVRRQKTGIGSMIVLVLMGAVFLATGLQVIKTTKVDPSWAKTTGRVVSASSHINDGTTMYTPIVQYQVNGQSYQTAGSSSSSNYPAVGSAKQVAYNPSRPQQAKVDGGAANILLYIFPAVGIGLMVWGVVGYVKSRRRNQSINNLVQSGQKLQGVLTDVLLPAGNNGNNTYKIVVTAADNTGAVRNFVSDSLMGIGGLAMADFRNTPIPIDVYINPADPNDYYVDVSDIPSLTPERIAQLVQSTLNRQPNVFATGERPGSLPLSPAASAPAATQQMSPQPVAAPVTPAAQPSSTGYTQPPQPGA